MGLGSRVHNTDYPMNTLLLALLTNPGLYQSLNTKRKCSVAKIPGSGFTIRPYRTGSCAWISIGRGVPCSEANSHKMSHDRFRLKITSRRFCNTFACRIIHKKVGKGPISMFMARCSFAASCSVMHAMEGTQSKRTLGPPLDRA